MIRNISHRVKLIKGSEGRTPTAAAAYRAGAEIYSEKFGENHDYTKKQDVVFSEINLPDNAPDKFLDRAVLWNEVEKKERQSNGQYAREITADFDRGLSNSQMIELARRHIKDNFTDKEMIADWSIHQSRASDGGENPHIHIMLTLKGIKGDSFGTKNRTWNNQELAEQWHENWAELNNEYLEDNDSERRVTNKSFKERRIDKMPTIHLGVEASAMERKGIETDRGNINRFAMALNEKLRDINLIIRNFSKGVMSDTTKYLQSLPSLVQINRKKQQLALANNQNISIDNNNNHEQDIDPPDNGIDR